jgi:hypothetical protein
MNASGQAMISINVDKRHRDIWKLSRLRREISSEAFIIQAKMKINLIKLKGNGVSPKNQEHNNNPYRATFAHQLLGGRADRSFGGRFNAQPRKLYCVFMEKTRATLRRPVR